MKRLFTSCFGLGLLPLAPGTWGSLPPAAVFALLAYLQTPVVVIVVAMAAFVLVGSVICVMFAPTVAAAVGKEDPGEVVADEFAGQSLVFIPAVLLSQLQPLLMAGLGFVLFRLFDIAKPWPIRKLEKLPNGWGILADDLLAGVYAAILLLLVSILKSCWAV